MLCLFCIFFSPVAITLGKPKAMEPFTPAVYRGSVPVPTLRVHKTANSMVSGDNQTKTFKAPVSNNTAANHDATGNVKTSFFSL